MSARDAGRLASGLARPAARVRAGAAACALVLLALAAVASHRYREQGNEALLHARDVLHQVRREEPLLRAWLARHATDPRYTTPESVRAELHALVQALELPLQRSTTAPDGTVTVVLAAARYDRFIAWLDRIAQEEERGMRIERLAVMRTETPGLVDVELRVRGRRGAGG